MLATFIRIKTHNNLSIATLDSGGIDEGGGSDVRGGAEDLKMYAIRVAVPWSARSRSRILCAGAACILVRGKQTRGSW